MSLRDCLCRVLEEYNKKQYEINHGTNKDDEFFNIIRTGIPSEIKNIKGFDVERYNVIGCSGKPRWPSFPYILIKDQNYYSKKEANKATSGVYIVYLFNKDKQELTLELAFGSTEALGVKKCLL